MHCCTTHTHIFLSLHFLCSITWKEQIVIHNIYNIVNIQTQNNARVHPMTYHWDLLASSPGLQRITDQNFRFNDLLCFTNLLFLRTPLTGLVWSIWCILADHLFLQEWLAHTHHLEHGNSYKRGWPPGLWPLYSYWFPSWCLEMSTFTFDSAARIFFKNFIEGWLANIIVSDVYNVLIWYPPMLWNDYQDDQQVLLSMMSVDSSEPVMSSGRLLNFNCQILILTSRFPNFLTNFSWDSGFRKT